MAAEWWGAHAVRVHEQSLAPQGYIDHSYVSESSFNDWGGHAKAPHKAESTWVSLNKTSCVATKEHHSKRTFWEHDI